MIVIIVVLTLIFIISILFICFYKPEISGYCDKCCKELNVSRPTVLRADGKHQYYRCSNCGVEYDASIDE